MKEIIKNYTNGEVTVVWKPSLCIHSAKCWRGENSLPEVFNPAERPWIKPEGATTERIIEQIKSCPSGALTYYMNNEEVREVEVTSETIAEVSPNGPLLVYGNLKIKNADGTETKKTQVTAFCRCGQSGNKPFCDGMHRKIGFEG